MRAKRPIFDGVKKRVITLVLHSLFPWPNRALSHALEEEDAGNWIMAHGPRKFIDSRVERDSSLQGSAYPPTKRQASRTHSPYAVLLAYHFGSPNVLCQLPNSFDYNLSLPHLVLSRCLLGIVYPQSAGTSINLRKERSIEESQKSTCSRGLN